MEFELKVNDFDNGGLDHPYSDVLHFTATDKTCCGDGDRLPGVFLHRDGRVIIGMWMDDSYTNYYTTPSLVKNQWLTLRIRQEEVDI